MRTVYEVILLNPRRVVVSAMSQANAMWLLDYYRPEFQANQWNAMIMWREV